MSLETKEIVLANGRRISFDVAREAGRGAFFVLGVRKSGSSMLNLITDILALANDLHAIDVAGDFFDNNIRAEDWVNDEAVNALIYEGNVYGGFREMPLAFAANDLFRVSKKVLLVRDPRDALVSEHFSRAYSHSIPAGSDDGDEVTQLMTTLRQQARAADINASVLEMSDLLAKTLMDYAPLLADPMTVVFRYEDIIFEKSKLIHEVCRHFGWSVADDVVTDILNQTDLFPSEENEREFVRKVVPGDHREKLRPHTISELNAILAPAMQAFGYAP